MSTMSCIKLGFDFPFESSTFLQDGGSNIVEGDPCERAALITASANGLIGSGVWEAQPYTEIIAEYPAEETCYIIRGEVSITPLGEPEVFLKAGDSYHIPKGFSGTFSVRKTLVKVFQYNAEV
ncbi:cupin domain-containing protein [Pseudomonas sp. PB3P13]